MEEIKLDYKQLVFIMLKENMYSVSVFCNRITFDRQVYGHYEYVFVHFWLDDIMVSNCDLKTLESVKIQGATFGTYVDLLKSA